MHLRLAPLLGCFFLAACVTLGESHSPLDRPAADTIRAFSLEGRLSVKQGEKSYQAGIQWQHGPDQDRLFLTGPLGQGLAELERTAEGAKLLTSDQKTVTAADADALARDVLGFDLPLAHLPDWVLGRGQSVAGWRVDILRRESDAPNALPQLLELQQEDLTVRIKIDQWQLNIDPQNARPAESKP